MSDENTPKFRLRPKLAGGPPAITPAPVNPPEEAALPEAPASLAAPEVKPAALRLKLALKADEPVKSAEPSSVPPRPVEHEPGPYLHDPRAFPPPPAKQLQVPPRLKPTLIPSAAEVISADSGATPPFPVVTNKDKLPAVLNAPPPPRVVPSPAPLETWPAVLDAPPPPGLAPTIIPSTTEEEPAEITAIRKASTFPFPSPTAKFPPLPGLGTAGDTVPPESVEQEGFLKKLLLFGTLTVLVLAAVGAFAYFKFFAKPAASHIPPPAAASGKALPAQSPATENKTQKVVSAPPKETVAADPAPAPLSPAPVSTANTATAPTEPTATQEPAVVAAPPPVVVKAEPPQPSLAFKAWVINLRIRGVRGGEAQRVFIDKTSYVPGDVVNQQLGIIFVGYDESTRMLTFQDKAGATFERRH